MSCEVITHDKCLAAGPCLSRCYRLMRVDLDAVDRVRELKPELPDRGHEGYPSRDLWEFEKMGPVGGLPLP